MPQNKAWTLASFPSGAVRDDNFKLIESLRLENDGEVLVKSGFRSTRTCAGA
jgi:NADPH-dependent curcumin reductase CurA